MLPKITIVIPCYNAVSTIERTVKSLINQHYSNLELILIDGGSNDGTMEIIKVYQSHFTTIISEPDRGQAHALNKGFRLATGEIWGWLCADDEFTAGALLYFAKLFQNQPEIDAVSAGCKRIFADGSTFSTKPRADAIDRIAYHNGIEQPSTLWRAELHQRAGELDESYHYAFDWVWWNQLQQVGIKLLVVDRVVSRYYFSDTNKTSTGSRDLVDEMYRIIKHYGPIRGYLADIYLFLYEKFDLVGYYDKAPYTEQTDWIFYLLKTGHNPLKILSWLLCLVGLTTIFGRDRILGYNWNFASKQERNLCWYKYPQVEAGINPILLDRLAKIDVAQLSISRETLPPQYPDLPRPRIAIDCCCFQSGNIDSQRNWNLLLQEWSRNNFARQIVLIDRAKTAPQLYGFSYYDLPKIDWQQPGHVSLELQKICDREQIDIFLSTGNTIPICTPSVAFVCDVQITNQHDPITHAIYHASKYSIAHHQIATELTRNFPQIDLANIILIPPSIDELLTQSAVIYHASKHPIFQQKMVADLAQNATQVDVNNLVVKPSKIDRLSTCQDLKIAQFRQQYDLDLPYLLLVGQNDREDEEYTIKFFQAFAEFTDRDRYAIVWVNRTSPLASGIAVLLEDHPLLLIQLEPAELRIAYTGAVALMAMNPVAEITLLEAIFCGCPIVTNRDSSISKLLGNAALYISNNINELVVALEKIQQPCLRDRLIQQGFEQAKSFSGHQTAKIVAATICETYQQIQDRQLCTPNPIWQSFRELQIATDGYVDNLMEMQEKLLQAQQTIASMKTTKFWKMREYWFALKQKLQLTK
jgi:glycosyltransferase involved in cell wall biosynthesis